MTVQTSMPDGIHPQTGEEIQFEAVVQTDGTLQVTRIISRQAPSSPSASPKREIMDWVNKWSGTMELKATETRDSLRKNYLDEKFGFPSAK